MVDCVYLCLYIWGLVVLSRLGYANTKAHFMGQRFWNYWPRTVQLFHNHYLSIHTTSHNQKTYGVHVRNTFLVGEVFFKCILNVLTLIRWNFAFLFILFKMPFLVFVFAKLIMVWCNSFLNYLTARKKQSGSREAE